MGRATREAESMRSLGTLEAHIAPTVGPADYNPNASLLRSPVARIGTAVRSFDSANVGSPGATLVLSSIRATRATHFGTSSRQDASIGRMSKGFPGHVAAAKLPFCRECTVVPNLSAVLPFTDGSSCSSCLSCLSCSFVLFVCLFVLFVCLFVCLPHMDACIIGRSR